MVLRYRQAFGLVSSPRYEDPVQQANQIQENLFAQAEAWRVLRRGWHGEADGQAELRWVSDPARGQVQLQWLTASSAPVSDSNVFDRFLPPDYEWQRYRVPDDGRLPTGLGSPETSWQMVHITRRLDFIDLPTSWHRLFSSSEELPDRLQPTEHRRVLPPLWPLTNAQRERVTELLPLCLPLLGPITETVTDRRRLPAALLQAGPCVISLVLHPVSDRLLESVRAIAGPMRRWLDRSSREMAGSGFARADQIRQTFERFLLPTPRLCGITIRVAAAQISQAISVAHVMCANWGGQHAFEIQSRCEPGEVLLTPTPMAPICLEGVRRRLEVERIEVDDPEPLELIGRLPQLITMDEAELLLRLPLAHREGLPGLRTHLVVPFSPLNQTLRAEDFTHDHPRVRLGTVESPPRMISWTHRASPIWHSVCPDELTKHALIAGSTGSGKSVASQFLLQEVHRLNIPFLVIEPVKTEYFDALQPKLPNLKRWRLESNRSGQLDQDFLIFDPLRLQRGVTVARHIAHLKTCFTAAFPMSEVMSLIFENGLRAYLTSPVAAGGCGFHLFQRGGPECHQVRESAGTGFDVFPSFHTFARFFLDTYLDRELNPRQLAQPPEFVWEIREAFRRRFDNLTHGVLGHSFRLADQVFRKDRRFWNPFPTLLSRPTVVELDGLVDNEQKALLMAFLITFLVEHRQAEDFQARQQSPPPQSSSLRHLLLLEEAHRLLSASAQAGQFRGETAGADARARAVELFVDMLAEIRAYGQSLVVVEQIPSRLVADIVKNTNLKIMLRLSTEDERQSLAQSMNFNIEQQRFVATLQTGQAVLFEEHLEQPLLIRVPAPGTGGLPIPC